MKPRPPPGAPSLFLPRSPRARARRYYHERTHNIPGFLAGALFSDSVEGAPRGGGGNLACFVHTPFLYSLNSWGRRG